MLIENSNGKAKAKHFYDCGRWKLQTEINQFGLVDHVFCGGGVKMLLTNLAVIAIV